MAKSKLRQLVRLPWAADSCLWVGKLRTVLPLKNRVIRDRGVCVCCSGQAVLQSGCRTHAAVLQSGCCVVAWSCTLAAVWWLGLALWLLCGGLVLHSARVGGALDDVRLSCTTLR
jgi:hypothetical protein